MLEMSMYVILGYLSGSVLYAQVFARILKREGMIERSKDRNPGTANAFMYGGFWCGVLTLAGDLLKGFLPVYYFMQNTAQEHPEAVWCALVIAAPVVGHAFPCFYGFRGGKGIAVSFGCLLGLCPFWKPVIVLALFFIFFSLILRITPHFYRTMAAYLCSLAAILLVCDVKSVKTGFFVITVTVCGRLLLSSEERQEMEVKLLWKH